MGYTYYNPLKVWLDPASIADVVAHIQEYLTEYPLINQSDIEQIVVDYITAHPELVGGVDSVNGKTGEVVLTASDINTSNNTTIQAVLTALSGQISEIVQTITGLDTRITTNATGITNEATARANADTALGNRITALQGAVGSPLVASTAAAMTDTSKIYVYTGSESGYTNGNWYYYNGSAWASGGVYNATAINTDTTLTVAGMAADAKATGDGLNDLKSAFSEFDYSVGTYLQKFTMNNQYLATYYTRNFGSIYFKLLTHPSATFAGVRIYGVTGSTETEITSGSNFIHEEFYWSGISDAYEKIKITVGFGSRVSGDIYVLLACAGGNDMSSLAVGTALNLKDLVRSVDKGLTGDLYKDIPFISGKNIVSDFSKCTVDTYLNIIRDSAVGSVASRAVKIRNDDGTLITPIYFVVPASLDTNSATMCWTFDKDGNPIGNVSGAHLNDGFADNVYYIVLVNYTSGNGAVSAIYDSTKEYTFEVSASGKPFTAFSDCVKRIAHIPYKKKVLVYAGEYDIYSEIGGDTFANSIPTGTDWRTVSPVVEDNTKVIGIGRVILRMTPTTINANASTLLSPLNISGNVTVENIGIECSNTRYGIHIEGSNIEKYNNSVCTLKNVRVTRYQATEGPAANGPAIGVGMNARSRLVFDNCYVNAIGGWAGLYFHENTTTLELSPSLQISDSVFKVRSGYALALSASANQTTMIDVYIAGSFIEQIRKMTGGSSEFNDAYKIVMTNCNAPAFSKSDLLQNEVAVEQYNTIA